MRSGGSREPRLSGPAPLSSSIGCCGRRLVTSPDEGVAEISRQLSASAEKVFSAFAKPAMVSRWLTSSPDIRLTVLELDFRVSGRYRFAYRVPNGQSMVVNGAYRLIEPPSRIVFSWNIEPPDEHAGLQSEVTVEIT